MKKETFKKFLAKLRWEGFLRSFLCGLVIGFAVLLVTSSVCWIVGFKGYWLGIVLFATAVAVTTVLFYFLRFSPNTKKMAKRIDDIGLEERIITMTELEGDDSFIAVKQREDAMPALGKVNASAMKLVISVPVIIACAAIGAGAVGMTTVYALNIADVVPSGIELVRGEEPEIFYNIAYSVDGEGVIYGVYHDDKDFIGKTVKVEEDKKPSDKEENKDNAESNDNAENKDDAENKKEEEKDVLSWNVTVKAGEMSDAVVAVANEGYVFVGWSDGYSSPFRESTVINENKIYTAIFQEIPDAVDEDKRDIFGNSNNKGENVPPAANESSANDNKALVADNLKTSGEESTASSLKLAVGSNDNSAVALAGGAGGGFIIGIGGSGGGGGSSGPGNSGGDGSGGDGAGWQDNSDSKKVIDGKTYYGDVFDESYVEMMAYLDSEDVPDYIKKIIKDYFDTIAVQDNKDDTIKPID